MVLLKWCHIVAWLSFICFSLGSSVSSMELTKVAKQYRDFIIPITDGNLDLVAGVRDYFTLIIITTSNPQHGCKTCDSLSEVVSTVSKSWAADYEDSNLLFFLEIDISDQANLNLVQYVQMNTIPHVWLVPPNPKEQMDPRDILKDHHYVFKLPKVSLRRQTFELANFLAQPLLKKIQLRNKNSTHDFLSTFVITLFVLIVFKKRGPRLIVNLGKSFAYKILTILFIISSITGFQYTRMKGVPFVAKNDKGEMIVISGGTHFQFGIEVLILSLNYFLLGASVISLIYMGNYQPSPHSRLSPASKNCLILFNSFIIYILYSILTSIAIRKDHDYPYWFTKLL